MRWEDESYVKLYVRDTLTWLSWSWQARTVFMHLLRKVDLAGILECEGFDPTKAVSVLVGLPAEVVDPGLAELARSGTIEIGPGRVVMTKFVEAQEARKTERVRKKDQRQRDRDKARGSGFVGSDHGCDQFAVMEREEPTENTQLSHDVTRGHAESHGVTPAVTPSHAASHDVTRGHSPAPSSSPSPTSSPVVVLPPKGEQQPLPVEDERSAKPTSAARDFARWMDDRRIVVLGRTTARSDGLKRHVWARLGELLRDHGRKTAEAAWLAWERDAYALKNGLPIRLFASQWGDVVAKLGPSAITSEPVEPCDQGCGREVWTELELNGAKHRVCEPCSYPLVRQWQDEQNRKELAS